MDYELILNATARRVFEPVCSHDVEMVPIEAGGVSMDFSWMRLIKVCDCLDLKASGAVVWQKGEIVPSKVGHFKSLAQVRIDMDRVPSGVQVFRTKGWGPGILVSEELQAECEANRLSGIYFDPL